VKQPASAHQVSSYNRGYFAGEGTGKLRETFMVKYQSPPNFFALATEEGLFIMVRILLTSLLAGTCAFAQAAGAPAGQALSGATGSQASAPPVGQQPLLGPDSVAPNAAVVEVRGICPKSVDSAKADSCKLVITKEQFNAMLAGMNVTAQITTPTAMRSFAESYVQLLALANAGEKSGIDKDPRFQELLRIARIRSLADAYRRSLDEKFSNPLPQEIEAYYQQNISKYEVLKVERIIMPSVNPNRAPAARAEFEKKFQQLASEIRERAAKGEETQKLQDEAYKALALPSPPKTDLGMKRRGVLPAGIEKDLFALKPGEVTKLEAELSGLNVYKLRSRDTIPLEFVKDEIVKDLHQKNMETAMQSVTGAVHADLNEHFFGPAIGGGGPIKRVPQSSAPVPPNGLSTNTPLGATSAPGVLPADSGKAVPAKNTEEPASQKPPVSPK
jgi:hypothetical protein